MLEFPLYIKTDHSLADFSDEIIYSATNQE